MHHAPLLHPAPALCVTAWLLKATGNYLPGSPSVQKSLWLLPTVSLEGLRGRGMQRKPLSFIFLLSI